MRVVMIGPFGMKPKGTMAVRALPLARALHARGHELTILLPPWSYPQDAGKTWSEGGVRGGVRVENVTISPSAGIPFRLFGRARELRPDVIHVFKPKGYSGLTQWSLRQARRLGMVHARVVLDTDDWEGAGGWNELEPYSRAQKKFFAWQEQWGLRNADAVTVASRALETITWSLGVPPTHVRYVPNGVNPLPRGTETRESVRSELGLGDAPVMLLYTRFFEFGLERLFGILSHVWMRMPNAKLLLIGNGLFGEEKQFMHGVQERGWQERVIDAGWVESERLVSTLRAGDVALFPFDDTLVNRCKCSVKLIDLLANGVPVVGEAVGQVKEYIRHNETGMLVAPNDTDGFGRAIVELLSDAEQRAQLGTCAAAATVRDFSWDALAGVVEAVYRGGE